LVKIENNIQSINFKVLENEKIEPKFEKLQALNIFIEN
jgi:hypothetical protein